MATTIAQLLATLGLDASDFDKGIDQAEGKGNKLSQTMSGLSAVGGGILATGLTTAAAGAAILGKELFNDVNIAADAQKVQAQLQAVLKSTGGAAGVTADQANSLADSLSKVTAFDDEAVLSGENVLLTFTNIGKDVFPEATSTILDMSQALGQDLQSSAIQLGKALNDPVQGMTALQRVGVTFTDEQKQQAKAMQDAGNIMGAQQIVLAELKKEFGDSAKAAGSTFAGQMTIIKNQVDNFRESVGTKLIPIIQRLITYLMSVANSPGFQNFLNTAVDAIVNFVTVIVDNVPKVIQFFQNLADWFVNNKPIIVGILAALGVAVLAFGITTAIAAATAIAPLLPVIAIMAAVGAIAYVVYRAWTENWGGIQQKVAAVWAALQPAFNAIRQYLSVAIPAALAIVKLYWDTFTANLKTVWSFISTYILPLFNAVGNVLGAVLGVAIRAAAGYFQNVLLPQMRTAWEFISKYVLPILQTLGKFLSASLGPAFRGIGQAIQGVISFLNNLAAKINSLTLPSWLTPGSPTPFEMGLRGIASALDDVNGKGILPNLQNASLNMPINASKLANDTTAATKAPSNYNITINNPTGENSETSTRKALKKLSYLGAVS